MKEEDRRAMLRGLTDAEYLDVMTVCAHLPFVEMNLKTEGNFIKITSMLSACACF